MLRTRDRESVIGGGKPGVKEDKKDERVCLIVLFVMLAHCVAL